MCCEDLKIGRAAKSAMKQVVVGQTSLLLLSPSPLRLSMILLAPLAGTVTYSPENAAVPDSGVIIVAGGSPLRLTLKDHGSLVRDRWTVIADAADRVAGVIFSELPEDVCVDKL